MIADLNSEARSVEEAVQEYLQAGKAQGWRDESSANAKGALRAYFEGIESVPLNSLTPRRCDAQYQRLVARLAVASHRSHLKHAKLFLKWCTKMGYIRTNPAAEVEGVGRAGKGKPQLTRDEARKWLSTAQQLAACELTTRGIETHQCTPDEARQGAIVAMCLLLMGLRSREALRATVRELDDGGATLTIVRAKTAAGCRRAKVPEVLRPLLLEQARDKLPKAPLFPNRSGGFWTRYWARLWVARICDLAGVPRVCAHSMRGLHASLAIEAGATGDIVAASLGHTSSKITLAHYASPGSADAARQATALRVLQGGI